MNELLKQSTAGILCKKANRNKIALGCGLIAFLVLILVSVRSYQEYLILKEYSEYFSAQAFDLARTLKPGATGSFLISSKASADTLYVIPPYCSEYKLHFSPRENRMLLNYCGSSYEDKTTLVWVRNGHVLCVYPLDYHIESFGSSFKYNLENSALVFMEKIKYVDTDRDSESVMFK